MVSFSRITTLYNTLLQFCNCNLSGLQTYCTKYVPVPICEQSKGNISVLVRDQYRTHMYKEDMGVLHLICTVPVCSAVLVF